MKDDIDHIHAHNIHKKISLRVGGKKKLEQLDDGEKMIGHVHAHDLGLKD